MLKIAEKDNLNIIDIKRESHSAKDSGKRPVCEEMLDGINNGRYNAILTWAPDRLSRNAGDLGSLVDLMDQKKLVEIKTYGQCFTNNPSEKLLLMILCSQAKLKNDNKAINVKRGLKTRCEMGLRPSPAPTGYLNEKRVDRKCKVIIDPERTPIIKQIFEKVVYEHYSGRKIHKWLKDINFTARSGKLLSMSNVYSILKNTFYYGDFEFPIGSNTWYKGKHEAIITKELFIKAQEELANKRVGETRVNKEFVFTKLIKCGLCGSTITASEKFKKLKNGTIVTHIYYGCTRMKDPNCQCKYINEQKLIEQFKLLFNNINIEEIEIDSEIKKEILKLNKFERLILKDDSIKDELNENNIRRYANFILEEGSISEKRRFLSCVKNRIVLKERKIYLENNYK
jgi:DNA invertase Pin-like site-specific DNA recombinase/predicted metal-binding protein